MNKKIIMLFLIIIFTQCQLCNTTKVKADQLSDSISDQLSNIDLSELDNFYNLLDIDNEASATEIINALLKGEYSQNYNSIFEKLFSGVIFEIKSVLPLFIGIISISILYSLFEKMRISNKTIEISEIIFFVCFIGIILLLSGQIYKFYSETKNTIENIAKLTEIMSPIIITLMVASGGNTSAAIYSPSVVFLSGTLSNLMCYVVLPLVGLMIIFSVLNNLTVTVKLKKFSELAASAVKWILGIVFTIYTFFLSAQGIASVTHDGISIKAAKYTISNSIPIVGGFLRDGFDLVVAGSVLIKNSVGVAVLFILFYIIISKIISMIIFSWLLKLTAAITESISDTKISELCCAAQKGISYFIATILVVSLMLFITIVLMIISANAFL